MSRPPPARWHWRGVRQKPSHHTESTGLTEEERQRTVNTDIERLETAGWLWGDITVVVRSQAY